MSSLRERLYVDNGGTVAASEYFKLLPKSENISYISNFEPPYIDQEFRTASASEADQGIKAINDLWEQEYLLEEWDLVWNFITTHIFLAPILKEANQQIKLYFPESDKRLSVELGDVGEVESLLLTIVARLDPEDGFERLKALDHNWWLGKLHDTHQGMHIHLELMV